MQKNNQSVLPLILMLMGIIMMLLMLASPEGTAGMLGGMGLFVSFVGLGVLLYQSVVNHAVAWGQATWWTVKYDTPLIPRLLRARAWMTLLAVLAPLAYISRTHVLRAQGVPFMQVYVDIITVLYLFVTVLTFAVWMMSWLWYHPH